MSERKPYSRIYWSVMDDPKFDGIREDVRLFGSWSLCLVLADMAWPAPAYVPPTIQRSAFRRLVDCQLLDELPGHRFRVHGLDKERAVRSAHGAHAASGRWSNADSNAPSIAPSNAQSMPSHSQVIAEAVDETKAEAQAPREPDPADVYWNLTGTYPKDRALAWIDELASKFGGLPTIKALAQAHGADRHTNTLLGRAADILAHEARVLSQKAQAEVRAELEAKRAAPRVVVDPEALKAEIRRMLETGAAA